MIQLFRFTLCAAVCLISVERGQAALITSSTGFGGSLIDFGTSGVGSGTISSGAYSTVADGVGVTITGTSNLAFLTTGGPGLTSFGTDSPALRDTSGAGSIFNITFGTAVNRVGVDLAGLSNNRSFTAEVFSDAGGTTSIESFTPFSNSNGGSVFVGFDVGAGNSISLLRITELAPDSQSSAIDNLRFGFSAPVGPSAVPEPSSLAFLGLACVTGIGTVRRRRREEMAR